MCCLFRENSIKFELGIINKTQPASDIKGKHKYVGDLISFLGPNEFFALHWKNHNTSLQDKKKFGLMLTLGYQSLLLRPEVSTWLTRSVGGSLLKIILDRKHDSREHWFQRTCGNWAPREFLRKLSETTCSCSEKSSWNFRIL